jgi:hypothetical protein
VLEEDATCARWLDSPLFADGVNKDPSAYEQLAANALESSSQALCIDALKQPLAGVRLSRDLDHLERAVMVALLHHLGALEVVIAGQTGMDAVLKSVSLAARGMRNHVCEMRDLDVKSLKDDQEPREWSTYTKDLVARCSMVLNTAPVRAPEAWGKEGVVETRDFQQEISMVRFEAPVGSWSEKRKLLRLAV